LRSERPIADGILGMKAAMCARTKVPFTFGSNLTTLVASVPTTVTAPLGCTASAMFRFIRPST
jgi:hypothetical protein